MHSDGPDGAAVSAAKKALASAAGRLKAAGARDEALARFVPGRRVLLVARQPVMEPIGRVWRLGVLLLDHYGRLYATGATTRATDPGRRAYQSVSAEVRREYRAAAFRGPFARGETVNYDATEISFDVAALRSAASSASASPIFLDGGRLKVRWSAAAGDASAVEFSAYLSDRVNLLLEPPEGA